MTTSIDLLKKWSDLGNVNAMIKLAKYYGEKEDYDNAKKYYYMVLETGNYSMDDINEFTMNCPFKEKEQEALYLKAIKHKILGAYKRIVEWFNFYGEEALNDSVLNYCDSNSFLNLVFYKDEYFNNMLKYLLMASNDKSVNTEELKSIYLIIFYYLNSDYGDYFEDDIKEINGFYDVLKELYQIGVDCNIACAMIHMGDYYRNIKKDYDNMKKYYLMAIEKNNDRAMYKLGCYYNEIKDYDNMKKYNLMAIEKNNIKALNVLATYYKDVEKDYNNMKKYFLRGINIILRDGYEHRYNDEVLLYNLGKYYEEICDYDNMKKYHLMLIEHFKHSDSREDSLKILLEHYKQNNDEESYELIEKSSKQKLYGNHEIIEYYKMTKDYKRIFPEKCFRCLDKYIEPSKSINCIHKDICNECTKTRDECPKCGTKYC